MSTDTAKRSPRVPTAHAKVPTLLRSLHNAGWGALAGASMRGRRTVLQALSQAYLADGSGEGQATLWQLSQASGYSVRWVRSCLNHLEEMGIVTWVRGTIYQGKHVPSWFRIAKARLVELIREARHLKIERERAHQEAEAQRLQAAGVHEKTTWRVHKRRGAGAKTKGQGEVAAHLLTPIGGGNRDDLLRDREASINARHDAERGLSDLPRIDSALPASASTGGGQSAGAQLALALLKQVNPAMARKMERASEAGQAKREQAKARRDRLWRRE